MNPEAERSSRYTLLSSPWEGSGQKYSGTGAGSHNEVSSTPGTGVLNRAQQRQMLGKLPPSQLWILPRSSHDPFPPRSVLCPWNVLEEALGLAGFTVPVSLLFMMPYF